MTAKPRDPEHEHHRTRLACLVLALATVMVYLPVCWHDFTYLDDVEYVTDNQVVQAGLTWNGLQWAFTAVCSSNWHPLTWLSHMIDCELFGLNAGAQHFVNVLFHTANAVLLLLFWSRITRAFWPSAFVAALFAWHPLRVESVAWIAERKDVLSTLLGLLALWFYANHALAQSNGARQFKTGVSASVSGSGNRNYLLALLFFALGLMAKPMLVTLPFVFLLLDFWPLRRISRAAKNPPQGPARNLSGPGCGSLFLEKWPFFLLTVGSSIVTYLAQRAVAVVSLESCPVSLRLSNALVSYVRYLWKAVWPSNLAVIYPLPKQIPLWQPVTAGAALVILSLLIWQARRRKPYLMTGWFWFLGTLVPVIGLVQVGPQAMADRYTYVSLIGVSLAVAFGARDLAARFRLQKVMVVAAVLVLGGLLTVTQRQLSHWRNPELLLNHALAVTGDNAFAHQVLGAFLYDQGQRDRALAEFREALRIGDSATQTPGERKFSLYAHTVLARDFEQQGRLEEALAQYRIVLGLEPGLAEVQNDLGNLLDQMGRTDDALAHYREAVRLKPEASLAHNNLGTMLVQLGRFDEALREYAEAARLQPGDSRPHYLMGKAWLKQGRSAEAIGEFRSALRLNTNDFQALTYLARVLAADEDARIRNGREAVTLAEQANTLAGGQQPLVLDVLAMAHAELGRFSDAQQTIQKAIGLAIRAGETNMTAAMQQRLKLYQSGQPHRETFTGVPAKASEDSR